MIKLFNSTAKTFDTLGTGCLSDCVKAVVVEERNGTFELEIDYPIDGAFYSEIQLRSLIVCKSTPFSNPQAFRVYSISKPLNGVVTINACHISYDLSGIIVKPYSANSPAEALRLIKDNSTTTNPFIFGSNSTLSMDKGFSTNQPKTARSILGGSDGSILDTYKKGEYYFDNFNVDLLEHRGSDKGVIIKYGKNLTQLKHDEDDMRVYTGVFPFWFGQVEDENSEDGSGYSDTLVILDGDGIVHFEGSYDYNKTLLLDLTNDFQNSAPSKDDLKGAAEDYIRNNNLKTPTLSSTISFVNLFETEEYEYLAMFEKVELCDTVTVQFEELGVNVKAKCISTKYDAILDRYIELELGESRASLTKTIEQNEKEIEEVPTISILEQSIERATKLITGGLGGYVILHNSSGKTGTPDELLVLDPNSEGDYKKARGVWRFNSGGLGFSSNGYNGPFGLALTNDGQIVADKITTGLLRVGGSNMASGIEVYGKNAEGNEVAKVKLNSGGIELCNGTQIKWNDVNKTDMPNYQTASQVSSSILAGTTNMYVGATTLYYAVLYDGNSGSLESGQTAVGQPDSTTSIADTKVYSQWTTICPDVNTTAEYRTTESGTPYENKYRYLTRFYMCVRYEKKDSSGGTTKEFTSYTEIDNAAATTVITKNTITTSYVNSLEITAKRVRCEDLIGQTISSKTISGSTITGTTISSSSFSTTNGNLHIYGTGGSGSAAGIHMVQNVDGSGNEFDIGCTTFFCRWYDSDEEDENNRWKSISGSVAQIALAASSASDRRLKQNIKPLDLEFSKALIDGTQPKEFNFTYNKNVQTFGMIAQEVDELFQNIGYNKRCDLLGKHKDPDETWTLDYKQYIPHLINYVQDLRTEIDLLKEEVRLLKEGDDGK